MQPAPALPVLPFAERVCARVPVANLSMGAPAADTQGNSFPPEKWRSENKMHPAKYKSPVPIPIPDNAATRSRTCRLSLSLQEIVKFLYHLEFPIAC